MSTYIMKNTKHYRLIEVHFALIQAEWFECELCVCPCGWHPNSSGKAPGSLPPQLTHDDIWNHSHCCRVFLFVTAWNDPHWPPRPCRTQMSNLTIHPVLTPIPIFCLKFNTTHLGCNCVYHWTVCTKCIFFYFLLWRWTLRNRTTWF